jgi:small neutral amino acid transporter SnatA (MarC family)
MTAFDANSRHCCASANAERLLGVSGTKVVIRLSAFILLCIGILISLSGWSGLTALTH